jgi:hypothetical protein
MKRCAFITLLGGAGSILGWADRKGTVPTR